MLKQMNILFIKYYLGLKYCIMPSKNEQISELTILNEELENYFRNTIIPQLFIDADLILRKFTPPAMKQFKLHDTDIGKCLADIKENFRFPTIIENVKEVISSGSILEKEIQTTDLRWYQMNILPYVKRKDHKTNGVIVTFVDITPRITDLKELEKLIADHELLIDTIAHDLKTPLTSLGLTIEMLKKIPEKGMERFPVLIEHVESGLGKMKTIINDLVQSRWADHKYKAVEELLDIENIFEDVKLALAEQITEAKAKITFDLQVTEITYIRRRLRSIVYNLINNAIKYRSSERPLQISIRTYRENEYFVISIIDNGIGIDTKKHQAIFEKYGRVNNSIEGHGVGLYLVKEMLLAAGGRIEIESEIAKGAAFKIFLKQ